MKIFRDSHAAREKCNMGCEHHVNYNQVIEVEEVALEVRKVQSATNRWDNVVFIRYADAEGTIYYRDGDWSGSSPFLYTETEEIGLAVRPFGFEVRKDLDGNFLDYSGEIMDMA